MAWQVENSWGPDHGDKGYWALSADWFEEYVYQIAVEGRTLPAELRAVVRGPPPPHVRVVPVSQRLLERAECARRVQTWC